VVFFVVVDFVVIPVSASEQESAVSLRTDIAGVAVTYDILESEASRPNSSSSSPIALQMIRLVEVIPGSI
jgi:hypothetical protein